MKAEHFRVLHYDEREALKRDPTSLKSAQRARWHRYLAEIYGYLRDYAGELYLPSDVRPSLDEYAAWQALFPGWSSGPLTDLHSAWRPEYINMVLPMNELCPAGLFPRGAHPGPGQSAKRKKRASLRALSSPTADLP